MHFKWGREAYMKSKAGTAASSAGPMGRSRARHGFPADGRGGGRMKGRGPRGVAWKRKAGYVVFMEGGFGRVPPLCDASS